MVERHNRVWKPHWLRPAPPPGVAPVPLLQTRAPVRLIQKPVTLTTWSVGLVVTIRQDP